MEGNLNQDNLNNEKEPTMKDLMAAIDGVRDDLTGKIDGVRDDLKGEINGVRDELGKKIDSANEAVNELVEVVNAYATDVDKKFENIDSRLKGLSQGQENLELKMMNVAYQLDVNDLQKRVTKLEDKIGIER